MVNKELQAKFPKTELFSVIGQTGTPHPYCITQRHVAYASDRGRLDKEAIQEAERRGAKCGVRGCFLPYEDHKKALLIGCRSTTDQESLKAYVLSINEQVVAAGFAGYVFMDLSDKE